MGIRLPLLLNSGATAAVAPVVPVTLIPESQRILKRFGPSNLIVDQVPNFINKDHQTFRSFVEAYYEWLEQYQNAFGVIDSFTEQTDIDRTLGLFFEDFRSMYLLNFPYQLAIDSNGNTVSESNFLKNIRKFYGAKGSEKAYRFLFRLIYNVPAEVKYPSSEILKCSGGEWVERKSLKTTNNGGTANYDMVGNQIYQTDDITGLVKAYATVTDVVQYSYDNYPVTEIFITGIFGEFVANKTVSVNSQSGILTETAYRVISDITISSPGSGYYIGDAVKVSGTGDGIGLALAVDSVNDIGAVKSIRITDSGIGYGDNLRLNIVSNSADSLASISPVFGAITTYAGYYSGNKGKLSSNNRLFDGDFYQNFSYVLKSEISFSAYKELYKKLVHPAGFKMFGDVLIKRDIVGTLPFHSEMQRYELPFIGHYTPYRLGTTADLYSKYTSGFNPRGATYSTYQNYGGTGGKLYLRCLSGTTFPSGSWLTIASTGSDGKGITANIFEFNVINAGQTHGVLLLKQIDFDTGSSSITGAGFLEGATLFMYTASSGFTAQIDRVRYGIGVVPETGGTTHDTMGLPLGASGSVEGYIEAQGLSYSYWAIYHHPNTRDIRGLTGVMNGISGPGASFGSIALNPFFRMPIGYHFHSNAGGTPYQGTTGSNLEYGLIESTTTTSPNY